MQIKMARYRLYQIRHLVSLIFSIVKLFTNIERNFQEYCKISSNLRNLEDILQKRCNNSDVFEFWLICSEFFRKFIKNVIQKVSRHHFG